MRFNEQKVFFILQTLTKIIWYEFLIPTNNTSASSLQKNGGEVMTNKTEDTSCKKSGCGCSTRTCSSSKSATNKSRDRVANSKNSAHVESASEISSSSRATRTCSKASKSMKSNVGSRK